ncbi:MAG: SDR family NAD(P)-dependent oxidoreductase, partial [Verrucomicrobia bacterium]|nr:SDR family NAD(P)-dependent oxidoreductase [Verrucomicrobiota bacterium]
MSLLQRRPRPRPELPLVPLIDVLVMLVLFAYVTMQARSGAVLNLTLPKVDTAGKNDFQGKVTVAIDKEGAVTFNGQTVSDEQLITLLREVRNVDKDIPVLIKADETTQLKKLAFVMDACRKSGFMKIVLTGVTRGLGRALAKKFIALGHTVIGCGRSGTEIFDLRMDHGAPHDFMVCDVALDAKVALWAAKVLEHDAAPDILINNAGVMNPLGPLWMQSDREFTKVVDVNVRDVANVIRHFVPAMVARKKGVIVNLSSGWGRSVSPEVAPYCMS